MDSVEEVRFVADALARHGYPTFVGALRDAAAEIERLRAALAPFACQEFEQPVAGEDGWTEFGMGWNRDRIVDWFGPSDFRRASQAIDPDGAAKYEAGTEFAKPIAKPSGKSGVSH